MKTITVNTTRREELQDVTRQVQEIVTESGVRSGQVMIFVPHTTAGVTINENADPDVCHDILFTLRELVPHGRSGYRHGEGNSDAHVKASLMGFSQWILVEDGRLVLGTWQGLYVAEFDGPRSRSLCIAVSSR